MTAGITTTRPAPSPRAAPPPRAPAPPTIASAQSQPAARATTTDGYGAASRHAFTSFSGSPSYGTARLQEGNGLNARGGGLRSASGTIPQGAWDRPETIVGNLTQRGGRTAGNRETEGMRCAPSNLLASRLMQGPGPTADMLSSVASNTGNGLTDVERGQLRTIASDVRGRRASYEQLSQAQHLMFRAGNQTTGLMPELDRIERGHLDRRLPAADRARFQALRAQLDGPRGLNDGEAGELGGLMTRATGRDTRLVLERDPQSGRELWNIQVQGDRRSSDRSGMSDAEMVGLSRQAGVGAGREVRLDRGAFNADGSSATLDRLVQDLRPGESAMVRVAASDRDVDANHWITVGRQANGTPYIYNSDPGRGDHTLYVGHGADASAQPADFRAQLERYSERVRSDAANGSAADPTVTVVR